MMRDAREGDDAGLGGEQSVGETCGRIDGTEART